MVVILTADEVLQQGLMLSGFQLHRILNVTRRTNVERFKSHYGSDPVVYAQIWEDLQFTTIPEARIDTSKVFSSHFMMALCFLKCYPKEAELAGSFSFCETTVRKWQWFFVRKIQALKSEKVSCYASTTYVAARLVTDPILNRLFGHSAGHRDIQILPMKTFQSSCLPWMACTVALMSLNIQHSPKINLTTRTNLSNLVSTMNSESRCMKTNWSG